MTIPQRPSIEDLGSWLAEPLAGIANAIGDQPEISLLFHATAVADGTTVLLIRTNLRRRAVVLCSSPVSPDMVLCAMNRARSAKAALGPATGAVILDPLVEGRIQGLSYAVLPYCEKLSDIRPVWWIQRARLRPAIFEWLRRVTAETVDADDPAVRESFRAALAHLHSLSFVSDSVRNAARGALDRLDRGAWNPRHVLMHGDLWQGNILIRGPSAGASWRQALGNRFVIIDWPGSALRGYAIFDLVRLSQSMGFNGRDLRLELERHRAILGCHEMDSMSYLLAALGHIAMGLEHFPKDRFNSMVNSSLSALQQALEAGPAPRETVLQDN